MKRIIALTLIPVTLAGGIAGAAFAGTDKAEMSDSAEIQAALKSGMTLTQAVDVARKETGGMPMSAGWENNDAGAWGYEVEMADAAGAIQTWFVNPADGTVTKVAETQDDQRHGDGDEQDEKDGEADSD